MKTRQGYRLSLVVVALAAVFAFSTSAPADAQERKSLRWATSAVGSYGYAIASLMTKIAEEALGGEYTFTVQPYTSPTVAMKAVMDGNGEIAYTADIGMTEFHQRTGGFKGYKPKMPELVHTWYAYPMESMLAVPAATAQQFKCWKDFSGKPVFYTTAGFMNWLNWRRIYAALGYDFKHVQIDLGANADAMQAGTIVGSATYTTAGRSLAAYWRETELRMDIRVVNPCPDEVAKLKAAGLAVVDINPKDAFTKDVGPAPLMEALLSLQRSCDTVVAIDNNRLTRVAGNLPLQQALGVANELVGQFIKGTTETITTASLINIDFADLTAIMEGRGLAAIGVGYNDGIDRIEQSTRMALDTQLLDVKDMSQAHGALVHVTGGDDITLEEVTRAGELVTRSLPQDVRIVWGARVDPNMKGKARVMVVLTGVESTFGETKVAQAPVQEEKKKRFLGMF